MTAKVSITDHCYVRDPSAEQDYKTSTQVTMANVDITCTELQAQLKMAETSYKGSDNYHIRRPDYTFESVDYLLRQVGVLSNDQDANNDVITVLELGCGTGLFTEAAQQVLKGATNVRYIASDPLESMRSTFTKSLPDVELLACKAESIPLPDNSVNTILAANCYHWFANEQAYSEMYRVLKPNGTLGFITNEGFLRDGAPQWMHEVHDLVIQSYEKTKAPWQEHLKWKEALEKSGYFDEVKDHLQFRNFHRLTLPQCVKTHASYVGVIAGGHDHVREFEKQLEQILKKHFTDKGVEFEGIGYYVEIHTSNSKKTKE